MASWTLPYRVEAVDRDPGFYWQDIDNGPNDGSNDFFGQFLNFDGEIPSSMADPHGHNPSMPALANGLILDHPTESTASASSGVSTTEDEFDFFSCSSQVDATIPSQPASSAVASASHEVDPRSLGLASAVGLTDEKPPLVPRVSMSDPELPRVDGISLHSSPGKRVPISQPSSPTPPNTMARKPNKFVEALSSTIRKASKLRKPKKLVAMDRPDSPTMDNPPRALRLQHHEYGNGNDAFPPSPTCGPDSTNFVHGFCDDPFSEIPQPPPNNSLRFFSTNGIHTPAESPGVKTEPGLYHPDMAGQQPVTVVGTAPETWPGQEYMAQNPHQSGWWDLNLLNQNGEYVVADPQQQKNASLNLAMHAQHAELPYEYQVHDPNSAGLMIHMPQPRNASAPSHDLSLNTQTYLPPPPIPPTSERHRPPRAPSSGARHLSCSPIRKTRQPSIPPTPATAHSRHSSNGSVASARSASGRGIVPGTPTAMRKQRRSRDASGSSGGGSEIGFVNFTPSDGGLLMTGVAPSGSSKTKARREREAMERRRRLSEAAMKAVQAAGGDVDKLMEQGFAF
ncbi:hypothetical protein AU210_007770 [Fusarium oxysporum f. sp. radicis-cucumerinum]|uniref:Uncharacterized protein n=1 Tax=Fusarium oxysporum f. sp. radicis-cucumerinum TaxID=327505 RepID=A0A2H3GYP6_FUSOX|nr:hypothetical protein AU210_007770 [Fusarium oxysporum f. sp. radicis-cucumerinum]